MTSLPSLSSLPPSNSSRRSLGSLGGGSNGSLRLSRSSSAQLRPPGGQANEGGSLSEY
jgi:hypothetical protein